MQAAQYLHAVAMHGQPVAGPLGIKATAHHLWAADAMGHQRRPPGLHAVEQQACQQIARSLSRHHRDAGRMPFAHGL